MELVSKKFDASKSINFTELVKNSNTTQSLKLQTKMIDILNKEFTESEQQWYVANLYMYINYHPINDYLINLEHVFKMIGFANKANAKRTLNNNFTENEDYKITVISRDDGKFTTEDIMINTNTFKNLCMLAKTDKGKEIRKYYVKLENMNNQLIQEEIQEIKDNQDKLIKKLEYDTKQLLIDKDADHKENIRINRHNILIEKFNHKKCVYIAELDNSANLIKIGSTHNIAERIKDLCMKFGKCMFLQVYESDNFREIESSILHNELVIKYRYKEPINHYHSKEVVKLTYEFNYKQLLEIVEKNVNNVSYLTPSELLKRYELDTENKKLDIIQTFIKNGNSLSDILLLLSTSQKNINIENEKPNITMGNENITIENENITIENIAIKTEKQDQVFEIKNNVDEIYKNKHATNMRAPKGQKILKINPNNLTDIVETYDSMVYLLRSPNNYGCQKSCIMRAIKEATIYKGFRWNYVDKPLNATVVFGRLPPIRETIIHINEEKTDIIETYVTKDIAAKQFRISKLTMRNIIRNSEKFNNGYFVEFSKCPKELIDKYDKPIYTLNHVNSKKIKQICPQTNNVVIFNNLNDISIKYGICSATIIKAINSKSIYSGSLWEYA